MKAGCTRSVSSAGAQRWSAPWDAQTLGWRWDDWLRPAVQLPALVLQVVAKASFAPSVQ